MGFGELAGIGRTTLLKLSTLDSNNLADFVKWEIQHPGYQASDEPRPLLFLS